MRYAVIGAGVLGLTAALRLGQQGHDVTILERGEVPGGLASSFEVAPGIWLERFYHHIFGTDKRAIALMRELGLEDRLQWHRPVTTVMVDGVPRQLDSPGSLLRFDRLSVVERLRMAAALGLIKVMPSPTPLERTTAHDWMRRACGVRGHAEVWEPLLRAKFGDTWDRVSMGWLWARIHDRTSALGYLDGGFHQLYMALSRRVEAQGGEIRYGAPVRSIENDGGPLQVSWQQGGAARTSEVDRVVSTVAPTVTARLHPDLADGQTGRGPYQPLSAHCLVLALDRPLTGIYWIGAADRDWPFLAVVEHTAMLAPSAYGGKHLLYLGAYRPSDDPIPQLPIDGQLDGGRRAAPDAQPFLGPQLGDRRVDVPRAVRAADRGHWLPRADSWLRHGGAGRICRLDVPGLSPRSRPELLDRARGAAGGPPRSNACRAGVT